MDLFHLSDDEYIRRFDLAKLTEMYLEKVESAQPQTQADANAASLEFLNRWPRDLRSRGFRGPRSRKGNSI